MNEEVSIVPSDVEDGAIIEEKHVKDTFHYLMLEAHIPLATFEAPNFLLSLNFCKLLVSRERRGSVRLFFSDVSKWWLHNYSHTSIQVSSNAHAIILTTGPTKIVPSLNISEDLRAPVEGISYWVETYAPGSGSLIDIAFDIAVWRHARL
jgi:hypothetical protein